MAPGTVAVLPGKADAAAASGWTDLFVPGRLCLFGEHSDWAGSFRWENPDIRPGKTIVVGTEQGLYARARLLPERVLVVRTATEAGERFGPETFDLADPEALVEAAQRGGFWSYVAGMAYKMSTEFCVGGLEVDNYRTTLPLKKGLSSSAAVCVLIARAFNQTYKLQMSTRGEMQYAYEGERLTPSRCGKMDQACAYGPGVPVLMTYDGEVLHVEPAQLGAPLYLVLVDLRAAKDTVIILSKLQAAYPHASSPEHRELQALLGPVNEDITGRAVEYLSRGDAPALGQLMREAQAAFDAGAGPVCPEQLTAPVLHRVLTYAPVQGLVWGAKGIGSQGDGTAQLLCKDAESQERVCRILEADLGVHCMKLTIGSTTTTLQQQQQQQPATSAATAAVTVEMLASELPAAALAAGLGCTSINAATEQRDMVGALSAAGKGGSVPASPRVVRVTAAPGPAR